MESSTSEGQGDIQEDRPEQDLQASQNDTQRGAVDESIAAAIDWEGLKSVVDTMLDPSGWAAAGDSENAAEKEPPEASRENAEIMRKLVDIEENQLLLQEQLENLGKSLNDTRRGMAFQVSRMKDELIGERKIILEQTTFNTVVSQLDSLHYLEDALSPAEDNRRFIQQLNGVAFCLTNILLGMGFKEFNVAEGMPFDPGKMKVLGPAEGKPGVVLKAVLPGYTFGDVVIRPAGVLIFNPALE